MAWFNNLWKTLRPATRRDIEEVLMRLHELGPKLLALGDKVQKIINEFETFKESVADAELPADAVASLDRLAALVGEADDLNPDPVEIPPALPSPPDEPPPVG